MRAQALRPPKDSLLGGNALLFEADEPFGDPAQQRVWHVASQAARWPGVQEAVPGMNNLMIVFDPEATTGEQLVCAVREAWQSAPAASAVGRLIELPVMYGGAGGPDLDQVAAHCGLDIDRVVELHAQAEYSVYFLGAHPGFAYLSGLDDRLHMPRRMSPRVQVPRGSVVIGGRQAGVVAQATPSGWHLLGATDRSFFDPTRASPALLAPGDRVRFVPLGIQR